MGTDTNKNISKEKEIDLIQLSMSLWNRRKFILKISVIGLIIGIIIAFSIPKEYSTTVILAPESKSGNSLGNAGALAAMAGINLGGGSNSGDLSSDIYPNIMESTPFILGLSQIHISDSKNNIDTTLFSYIKNDQKLAWWNYVLRAPGTVIALFASKKEKITNETNKLILTRDEIDVVDNIKSRETISIDKKTGVITLNSVMQSPSISAIVADTLTSYLQSYIIKYRTEKARSDLAFAEKLYNESKNEYNIVQQKYAEYLDRNQNVILASYRVNQEKLQNEVTLAYNVYNQVAQQLQVAKVKVQDQTPVYTVIQPAIVPLSPTKPNKKLIIIGFVFLFAIGASVYVLGKNFWQNLKA